MALSAGRLSAWLLIWGCLSASPALASEIWVSAGAGGSADALYSYGGATLAPYGTLNDPGWRARAWGKALQSNNGAGPAGAGLGAQTPGVGVEAELGRQFVGSQWRFALYAGAAWRNEEGARSRLGATLAVDASYQLAPRWRVIADAKYTAGLDEIWAQLRPEFKFSDTLYIGLVSSLSDGRGFSNVRAGASLGGLSYAVPWMGDVYLSVEGGVEYNVTTKNAGPFAALHLGFAY